MRRALLLPAIVAASLGCSLGQGTGEVKSESLFAHDCWGKLKGTDDAQGAPYDLQPDFFAAIPFRETLLIRVQRGTDLTEVSDGLSVQVDDVDKIRKVIAGGQEGGKQEWKVSLSAGVVPPGSPPVPPPELIADPPLVHMALYLQRSCHNQNSVLYAVSGSITFDALFNADPNETEADQKLTDAAFTVKVGDLRDVPLGHYPSEVPEGLLSEISGRFRFYFERGQPGQPFP